MLYGFSEIKLPVKAFHKMVPYAGLAQVWLRSALEEFQVKIK
jgi:hypothetical protein